MYLKLNNNVFIESRISVINVSKWVSSVFKAFPAGIYLLKDNNKNTIAMVEICSKLGTKVTERH